MSISVGICGTGAFAQNFIPLFKAHPLVDRVVLCDLNAEKLANRASQYDISDTLPSLDDLCDSSVDAIAIFTQNWLHGPQAAQALRAGKHVYSAVPSTISLDQVAELVAAVEETGRIYMIGETSYYYPAAIFCRERFSQGAFGHMVFGEAQYYHDWDHGLYDVMKWRGGENWLETAGSPPMHYPTHSVSLITSVTGAYALKCSGFGWVDEHEDGIYSPGVNIWENRFSNESALFHMSDGSIMRVNEFRRVGHPGTVSMSLYGTDACFEDGAEHQAWMTKDRNATEDVTDLLSPIGVSHKPEGQMAAVTADDGTHVGASRIHAVGRLPREFIGLPNGHLGSHQFLVDDFLRCVNAGEQPPCNVWQAARYLVPGLIAHESAACGGQLMDVPDFGDGGISPAGGL